MKKLMNRIDRFCVTHPNFGIPDLMKYIAIGNAVFWVLGLINSTLMSYMTFNPALILRGQLWRIISFIFYPPSTDWLALIAIYFYYMIGRTLEAQWGTAKFTLYFFTGIVLTELYGLLLYVVTGASVALTATYVYLSMFFSFAVLFPDMQVLLFFIIPIKMKWLGIVDGVFFLITLLSNLSTAVQTHYIGYYIYAFLPVVAVLNFLIFCWGDLSRLLPRKRSAEAINFKKESARIRREQAARLYHHKCSVCGRTDTDYPELEFRYCSRCQGYHCFCQDHINSHVHFTE